MTKKIKICGLFDSNNIRDLAQEDINLMGFIFYPQSKRYIRENIEKTVDNLPSSIQKVGVFVNATKEEVTQRIRQYALDYIQLHGDESPDYCAYFHNKDVKVIKAFALRTTSDLQQIASYSASCDLFVFDSPTPTYGGSGVSFDWKLIEHYNQATPYLLSGGLGLHNIKAALTLEDPRLIGFDFNSKLENEYHLKDRTQVQELIKKIREYERI